MRSIRPCHLQDAPTYFDFWATKTSEYFYKKHAPHGVCITMQLADDIRRLNDGNEYRLGYKMLWSDPVRAIMQSPGA